MVIASGDAVMVMMMVKANLPSGCLAMRIPPPAKPPANRKLCGVREGVGCVECRKVGRLRDAHVIDTYANLDTWERITFMVIVMAMVM